MVRREDNPYAEALEVVQGLEPEARTRADVERYLSGYAQQWDAAFEAHTERATCQCGQPIERLVDLEGERWRHTDPGQHTGCRAASYKDGQGWDDRLSKNWYAKPVSHYRPAPVEPNNELR